MAQRPKTAAEIAEQEGKLNDELFDSASIVDLRNKLEGLRVDIYNINKRLSWIVGSVRAVFHANNSNEINVDEKVLNEAIVKLNEIDSKALKIGDTLIANHDEN